MRCTLEILSYVLELLNQWWGLTKVKLLVFNDTLEFESTVWGGNGMILDSQAHLFEEIWVKLF